MVFIKEGSASLDVGKKSSLDTQTIAQVAITVALAAVLNLVPLFKLPQGGSVALDMIPIFFLAFLRGPKIGMLAGAIYGFVDYTIDPFFVHPAQVVLDYPLAFALVGLAGFFGSDGPIKVAAGVIIGATARFSAHLISGVIFFASYAEEANQNPWLYSAIYNGSYMFLSAIIAIPAVYAMVRTFKKAGGMPSKQ